MPKTRERKGAFTLDLGQPHTDQLNALIEHYDAKNKPANGPLNKTAFLRWLIWMEFERVKKNRNKSLNGG
jgi:hypothetical protein